MRRSNPPRLNRLPQRMDYTLVPAPLDLSGPIVDEKSPLPAIIVTPSSPCHETDFSIAFLAPPPKPSLRERFVSRLPSVPSLPSFRPWLPSQIHLPSSPFKDEFDTGSSFSLKAKTRGTIIFVLLLFIMACHLVMHRLVIGHPHLEFGLGSDSDLAALNSLVPPPSARFPPGMDTAPSDTPASAVPGDWLKSRNFWSHKSRHGNSGRRGANFIITDVDAGTPPPS